PQRLANLGVIVVQLGNRGGSPERSNAYQSFSYFNMRDYGLADKKAGLEQLAARYKWIDINRVGIYGHTGGGFLTAAALMLPPYNDFFKVGVSSSGNHDNNIYNQNWSEQYHGLRTIVAGAGRGGRAATDGMDGGQNAGAVNATVGNGGGGRGGRGGRGGNAGAGAATAASTTNAGGVRIVGPATPADTGYADDSLRYSI